MAGEITYQELFQSTTIVGLFRQLPSANDFFSRFLGVGIGDAPIATSVSGSVSWDQYAPTRTVATESVRGAPPTKIRRQPVGAVSARVARVHESLVVLDENIWGGRAPGGPLGSVDATGQAHLRLQTEFLGARIANHREFMASRAIRGGYGLKINLASGGPALIPVEKDDPAATIVVGMNIPAENFNQLPFGTGGSPIITEPWDDAAADINGQLMNLLKHYSRRCGRRPTQFLANSSLYTNMINNSGLAQTGGDAYRIFDSVTGVELDPNQRGNGPFYAKFRAMPMFTFSFYDGVLADTEVGAAGGMAYADTIAEANNDLIIPDGKLIILPEPSKDWVGWFAGSEFVRENLLDSGSIRGGFHAWATPTIDPSGQELKVLDNALVGITVPVYPLYATVTGF